MIEKVIAGNQSFLGGGLFANLFKGATAMVWEYIYRHAEEFLQIIVEPGFVELGNEKFLTLK